MSKPAPILAAPWVVSIILALTALVSVAGPILVLPNIALDKSAVRARVYKTLGVPENVYKSIERRESVAEDSGLAYLEDRVKNLYPPGTSRGAVTSGLKQMLERTRDVPRRKIQEEPNYIALIVGYQAKSPDTGLVWSATGTLAFSFDNRGLLKTASYLEGAQPADQKEHDAPDEWVGVDLNRKNRPSLDEAGLTDEKPAEPVPRL